MTTPNDVLKILFIGDIVGRSGRRAVSVLLPEILNNHEPHLVLANGENLAMGRGLTPRTAYDMFDKGIDFLTSGNHIWDQKDGVSLVAEGERVLRPANFSPSSPGRGLIETEVEGVRIVVMNFLGRVFMNPPADCPFRAADTLIAGLGGRTGGAAADGSGGATVVIVDFHAEATSEKAAMVRYLDGRVTAVLGTHTHVQTADERVSESGTASITDVGMTGSFDSVIGVDGDDVIKRFLTNMPVFLGEAGMNRLNLNSVLLKIDGSTGRALSISRINRGEDYE